MNGDGVVNISDLNAIISIIIDGSGVTGAADVNGDGVVNISDINAIISIIIDGPSHPAQEDDYVDLGLPSGTLWATRNVGASRPEDYGDYFAWGETEPKEVYTWDTYKWRNGSDSTLTKYCSNSSYGTVDNKTELDPEDDAAYVNWGQEWRIPSQDQIQELCDSCTWQWTTRNDVNGYLVTGSNGNSLFLPAAGVRLDTLSSVGVNGSLWSREQNRDIPYCANSIVFNQFHWETSYLCYRNDGLPIRPVRVPVYIVQDSLDLDVVPAGHTGTGKLTIVNNTMDSVTLTASADAPFLFMLSQNSVSSMTITVPGKSRETVTVMFTATTSGDFNGNVTFQCPKLKGGQSVIPVHAFAFNPLEDYVDLGLPSGTLWAMCNVGASRPREYGDYFAWGETSPKTDYSWSTYKWCDGSSNKLAKYCTDSLFGTVDGKTELDPEDDAAYVNWGASWRMPTLEQLQELCDSNMCRWVWNKNGFQVTGPNGNSIFLPAAGYRCDDDSSPIFVGSYADYWSSTLNNSYSSYAFDQYFYSTGVHWGISSRNLGFTVRAVRAEPDVYITPRSLDLGEVPVGETRTAALTIVNNTTESVILTATVQEPFLFKQEDGNASTMTLVVPVGSCKLSVMYTAAAPVTHIERRVTFQGSALEGGQCVIPVQAVVIYTSDYVDLGLPSGTLWATHNIGANSPEEYGDYFAWGETSPKEVYTVETYKWGGYDSDGQFYLSKYNSISGYGTIDNKNELEPEDDAAYVNWGPEWRMPSPEQLQELISNCTWQWTQRSGVFGQLGTGPNGNTLFLPAAGIYYNSDSLLNGGLIGAYWLRTLNPSDDVNAKAIAMGEAGVDNGATLRAHGLTVRPVRASQD